MFDGRKTKNPLPAGIKALGKQPLKSKNLNYKYQKIRNKFYTDDNKLLHNLYERIKELNCLYGLSEVVEKPNISLERILYEIVNLFPPSWQYPDITCAQISFQDK